VLLGAGGVGKTTLAAAYALALAREGRRVGLLGIDPARRLQTALGLALDDTARPVPDAGLLRAAVLAPAECLPRWAGELGGDGDANRAARERLVANAFFVALAERLATANDVFAAIRIAEWVERDPALEHLVVDTAPGLHAIEFLRRPEALSAFLEGPLVSWMRRLARAQRHGLSGAAGDALRGVAQRVLGGLARVGGSTMLLELADFLALAEDLLERMAERLTAARRWIADPSTEILLVAAVRDDAAHTAQAIAAALATVPGARLSPHATIVNHTLDPALGVELAALAALPEAAQRPRSTVAERVVRYARAEAALQARVVAELSTLAPTLILLPATRGLEGTARRKALAALGDQLRDALAQRATPTASSRQ
jgi:anion-transporting  ArsA/GET3 family ATPase